MRDRIEDLICYGLAAVLALAGCAILVLAGSAWLDSEHQTHDKADAGAKL